MGIFIEISSVIFIATFLGVIMRMLKQPLIVGYILAGIIAGPYFLNLLHSTDQMEVFSQLGITSLLFIVGLNLSPRVIQEVGKVSLLTGIFQVIVTTIIGFGISLLLGMDRIAALYISLALTFSSTIIILKLLSDKGDLNKLYGKIAIGFLLVQDIVASIILLVVSSFSASGNVNITIFIFLTLLKGLLLICSLYLISAHLLPRLSKFVAQSQELLFLFSITYGFGFAVVFSLLGFSVEIGALIAGVTLSLTPYSHEIGSRMRPLRDFFIVIFFILLGSHMILDNILSLLFPAIILSLFVLIGNPIIMIIIMNMLGFKRRVSFKTGLAIAQISEFSLILATLGFNLGHINKEALSLITLVGLITIAGSTYLILHTDHLYPYLEKYLKLLEFKKSKKVGNTSEISYDMVLFGYDRVGKDFIKAFEKLEGNYLVVDFNPQIIKDMERANIPFKFGDVEDVEFLNELNVSKMKLCVSTIPDVNTSTLLLSYIRKLNTKAIIIVLTHDISHAELLYKLGATYVIMPHYLGARYATNMIARLGFDTKGFEEEREKHREHLQKRNTVEKS